MPVSAETFRNTLAKFASGVTVVTTATVDGSKHGLTVSAFSSLSLTPPYILVCIDKRSGSIAAIESSQKFGVNILSSDQSHLSNRFASRLEDKFDGVSWNLGTLGVPLLEGALGQIECRLAQVADGGDHVIVIGEVQSAQVNSDKQPLLYFSGQYGDFSPQR